MTSRRLMTQKWLLSDAEQMPKVVPDPKAGVIHFKETPAGATRIILEEAN